MSEKATDTKTLIVVLHEKPWHSIVSDAGSFAFTVALIGLGVILRSTAMEWFGAILAMMGIVIRATRLKQSNSFTPQAAADKLLREFGVTGRKDIQ